MADVRTPQVGEKLMTVDDDGDAVELTIESVGEFDKLTDTWTATAEDFQFRVYWSDSDELWLDSDADFSEMEQ